MFVGEIPELTAKSNGGQQPMPEPSSTPAATEESKEETKTETTETEVKSVVGKHVTIETEEEDERKSLLEKEKLVAETPFVQLWIGVRYDEPVGKNNGTILDKKFFEAAKNCGGFVKPEVLKVGVMSIVDLDQALEHSHFFFVCRTILRKIPSTTATMMKM